MRKRLGFIIVLLTATVLSGCAAPNLDAIQNIGPQTVPSLYSLSDLSFSLVSLPAAGKIELAPVNSAELELLGLGGPSPMSSPLTTPFNKHGIYWSEPFPLVQGDSLQITAYSNSPVSWFGVDWLSYNLRGILATTEMDEDGQAFNPQYPAHSSLEKTPDGYRLIVNYEIINDANCVLVVKNANADNSQQLSLAVSLKSPVTFRRILKGIPFLQDLVTSERDEME